jgi:hypothetical protein
MAAADDDSGGATDGTSWDSIAAVDFETGEVTLLDREGAEIDEPLDTGIEAVNYVLGEGNELAVVADDRVGVIDLAAGTVEAPALPEGGRAPRVPTSEPLVLAAGPPEGGSLTIVRATASRDVTDAAQADDPLMMPDGVRSDLAGTRFAVAELRSLETVVVSTDEDDALSLPGLPIGLTEEVIVTMMPEASSEIRFWSRQGDLISAVAVPRPHAAVLGADGVVVLVTEARQVQRVAAGDEEVETVTTLDLPGDVIGGIPALGGQRLLFATDRGLAVLDGGGEEVATVEVDEPWRRSPWVDNPAQRCVVGIAESDTATMIDVESGETLGSIDDVELVGASSTDGCTVSVVRAADDSAIIRDGAEVSLEPEETVVAVAPTGDHVVVRAAGSPQAWLRDLDDERAEDVALGSGALRYAFVDH